jgi:hypothetical protein
MAIATITQNAFEISLSFALIFPLGCSCIPEKKINISGNTEREVRRTYGISLRRSIESKVDILYFSE